MSSEAYNHIVSLCTTDEDEEVSESELVEQLRMILELNPDALQKIDRYSVTPLHFADLLNSANCSLIKMRNLSRLPMTVDSYQFIRLALPLNLKTSS